MGRCRLRHRVRAAQRARPPLDLRTLREWVAPFSEELLKALFLLLILRQMRYAVDGAVYGFAVGIGFAVVENVVYAAGAQAAALDTAAARVLSVSLMHGFTTAIIGALLGLATYKGLRGQLGHLMLGLLGAIAIHTGYNQLVARLEGLPLLGAAIGIGLGGVVTLMVLIQLALRQEKQIIGDYLQDKLSPGELSAALNPDDVAAAVLEQAGVLDDKRLALVRQYVTLQAQRGILKKTLALNQRTRFTPTLERDLRAIEGQIRALRSAMGLYTWVWLRQILPSDESELWAQLNRQIDQPILNLLVELVRCQSQTSAEELLARLRLLRAGRLFESLPNEDLEDLALLLRPARYTLNQTIIRQGEQTDTLFFIAEGQVVASLHDAAQGDETILFTYGAHDHFGELSMLSREPHPATMTCLTDTVVFGLTRADFLTLVYAKPQVALAMMHDLIGEIRQRTRLVEWMRSTLLQPATLADR